MSSLSNFNALNFPSLMVFIQLIPLPIQAGTAIGIVIITALAGATEVKLIVPGKYTVLEFGSFTPEIAIAMTGEI